MNQTKNPVLITLLSILVLGLACLSTLLYFDFTTPFYRHPPQRFEGNITNFEKQDNQYGTQPGGLLFYGSSSIRGWVKTAAKDFPEHRVIIRGFGGSNYNDLDHYYDRVVKPHRPKTLIIYAGENDVIAHVWTHTMLSKVKSLIQKIRADLPDTQVFILSIKPAPHWWPEYRDKQVEFNQLLEAYTQTVPRLEYVDIGPSLLNAEGLPDERFFLKDRVHLNRRGYQQWTKVLKPRLNQ